MYTTPTEWGSMVFRAWGLTPLPPTPQDTKNTIQQMVKRTYSQVADTSAPWTVCSDNDI